MHELLANQVLQTCILSIHGVIKVIIKRDNMFIYLYIYLFIFCVCVFVNPFFFFHLFVTLIRKNCGETKYTLLSMVQAETVI